MTGVGRWLVVGAFAGITFGGWIGEAHAARNAVLTQTPAPNAPVTMGSTGTLTYQIANQNTGGNTGERIYEIRFRMSGGLSTFSSTTAAPAGWTRTAYSTTSVTFRANSWASAIATGASLNFAIVFNFRQTTADANELLRDIRARFTTTTSGPPFSRAGQDTDSNQGGWTLKSLTISFQFTDTSGNPISVLIAGNSYRLVMTVTNRSSTTLTSIVSVNNPPAQTASFNGSPPTPPSYVSPPTYNPNPLTLASGATGTITFNYNTSLTGWGTVYYTASARNNTGSATSVTVTSPTLSIGLFVANVTLSSTCAYNGASITVTMTLTNNHTFNIINVTPSLTPSVGAPVTLTSGPTPAAPNGPVPANGGTFVFQWVYQLSGATPGQTFTFRGSATGTGQTAGNPSMPTPLHTSEVVTAAGYNITVDETNATSTNAEITWIVNNQGCSPISSIQFTTPAGWTWNGDAYSLVDINATTSVENWGAAGPPGTGPVSFTAPSSSDYLYLTGDGEFRLSFSSTPTTTGPSTFTLTITHQSGIVNTRQTDVTVNTYNFNNLNEAPSRIWREDFR